MATKRVVVRYVASFEQVIEVETEEDLDFTESLEGVQEVMDAAHDIEPGEGDYVAHTFSVVSCREV